MSSRKLDELASDVDDATTIVHELQDDHDRDPDEKLDELDKTLEHASDTIDDLENKDLEHASDTIDDLENKDDE
jgi:hypothetical protein